MTAPCLPVSDAPSRFCQRAALASCGITGVVLTTLGALENREDAALLGSGIACLSASALVCMAQSVRSYLQKAVPLEEPVAELEEVVVEDGEPKNNPFDLLSDEVMLAILRNLDTPKELAKTQKLDRRFNRLAKDDALWKKHLLFPQAIPIGQMYRAYCLGKQGRLFTRSVLSDSFMELSFIAVDPINRLIAAPCLDHAIRIWDMHTKTLLHTLKGHVAKVKRGLFIPQHQLLVSGSVDGCVRVWSTQDGSLKHVLQQNHEIHALTFLSKLDEILSIDEVGEVSRWNLNGQLTTTFRLEWSVNGLIDHENLLLAAINKIADPEDDSREIYAANIWDIDGTLLFQVKAKHTLIKIHAIDRKNLLCVNEFFLKGKRLTLAQNLIQGTELFQLTAQKDKTIYELDEVFRLESKSVHYTTMTPIDLLDPESFKTTLSKVDHHTYLVYVNGDALWEPPLTRFVFAHSSIVAPIRNSLYVWQVNPDLWQEAQSE